MFTVSPCSAGDGGPDPVICKSNLVVIVSLTEDQEAKIATLGTNVTKEADWGSDAVLKKLEAILTSDQLAQWKEFCKKVAATRNP